MFLNLYSPPPLHSLPKKRFHAIFLKEVFSSITILQSEWFTKHEINVFFFMRRHKNKMRNRSTFKGRLGNAKFDQLAMNSGLLQGKETVLWVAPLTSFAPINSKLQHSLPRATNGHLTVVYVGGWWVWTLAGCGGEVSSIPSRTHVFFLLMWRFF